MPFPATIAAAIAEHEIAPPVGDSFAFDHACEGAKFHSPTPLTTHEVVLPDGTEAWLCATCSDNLEVFVALCQANGDKLPWPVRREFGNTLRALGERRKNDG